MKKTLLILSCLLLPVLQAQEFGDTIKLRLGGYLISSNETTISATTDALVGAKVNLQDDLGMDTTTRTFRLDGHYRFNDTHKVEFAYYRIHTDSTNTLDRDIEWDGATYNAGVSVSSHLNTDIYKINYAYSFYHNEKVELSLAAGLHMMDIETGIKGTATLTGQPSASLEDAQASFLAPLPVIGFRLDYSVTPRFHVRGSVDYFGISIDEFSGSFTDILISADYQVFDNFGAGAGLNITSLDASYDDGTEYEVNQQISGFLMYLTYNY